MRSTLEDIFVLCVAISDLSEVNISDFDKKEGKRKKWGMQSGDTYYESICDVKFVIGAADAKFELWFKGKQYTRPNAFKLVWDEGERIVPANKMKELYSVGRWSGNN